VSIGAIAGIVVIVLAVVFGIGYFIYRKLIGGAIAEDDLGEVAVAEEEKRDASNRVRKRTDALRDAWRRVRDGTDR
jgi:hypothetical protein